MKKKEVGLSSSAREEHRQVWSNSESLLRFGMSRHWIQPEAGRKMPCGLEYRQDSMLDRRVVLCLGIMVAQEVNPK